jgi:hypothetical protein
MPTSGMAFRSRVAGVASVMMLLASAGCYTAHVRSPAELRNVSGVEARVWLKDGSRVVLHDLAVRGDSLFGTTPGGGSAQVGVALDSVERLEEVTFDPLRPILIAGVALAVLAIVLSAIAGSWMQDY